MIRNYIKIAWRNLIKNKLYSLITISGMAIGMAVCILIMFYVTHEMSYDRFHKNAAHIYKLDVQVNMSGNTMNMGLLSFVTAPLALERQPLVKDYVRTLDSYKQVAVTNPANPTRKFLENKLLYADANFFKFFTFKLASGTPENVLARPFSVVISKDIAKKYFGDENPVGKMLTIKTDGIYNYEVTGVASGNPSNSSINFKFVASVSSLKQMTEGRQHIASQQAEPGDFNVYLFLNAVRDTAAVNRSLTLMAKDNKYYPQQKYHLLPLTKVHLENGFSDLSDSKYLKTFPLVAILILLLALVNYMSLATARATIRSKEVGVRKVLGAPRKAISVQFYIESGLTTIIAFILGYCLCYLFKPVFFNVLGIAVDYSFLYSPVVLALTAALLFLTVLIAGSYPSFVLSSFQPAAILKGKMSKATGGILVRKGFTILQFAISAGLIICGIVIYQQLYFLRHSDMGINKDNVVTIPVSGNLGKSSLGLKNEIRSIPSIDKVGLSHYTIFDEYEITFVDGERKSESLQLPSLKVDENYIPSLSLKWAIPPMTSEQLTVGKKIIINEAAIKKFQLPKNPVGSFLRSGANRYEVAGVLKDFHYSSMQYAIDPLAFFIMPDTSSYFTSNNSNLFVKIKPHTNLPKLIGALQNIYTKYDKATPFSFTFMDDVVNQLYDTEERLAAIFKIFIAVAICLAVMGLFGLAAFSIEQRMKEISIHKILGASATVINRLLFSDLFRLVFIAILIASPFAWWIMHNWLDGFAYRITISWWVFALSGGASIGIAVITISYHAIKVSRANPVDSLGAE